MCMGKNRRGHRIRQKMRDAQKPNLTKKKRFDAIAHALPKKYSHTKI